MNFDFVGKKKTWYTIAAVLIIIGLVSLAIQGLNLGIDFVGGTKVMLGFSEEVTSENLREILGEFGLENSYIQETDNNQFIVRTSILSEAESSSVLDALEKQLGEMEILSNEGVGSVISSELKSKAFIALLIATILIVVYITFRFEFSFAIAAIIALLHDILITVGVFSLFQLEVNISFVAAVLTILGYSINDTIVISDRIRENRIIIRKTPLEEIVNRSINQSLLRSINTSLTSIFALLALLIFGGETTKVFALALTIGFVSGTYSSIFIASPIWLELKKLGLGNKSKRATGYS